MSNKQFYAGVIAFIALLTIVAAAGVALTRITGDKLGEDAFWLYFVACAFSLVFAAYKYKKSDND